MTGFNQFMNALKGQFNTLNIILFLLVVVIVLNKWNRRRWSGILAGITLFLFLLFSTAYLPQYLTSRLESSYLPFDSSAYILEDSIVYVHVLGAGYADDERLPSNGKLSHVSLGRLSEGVRVANEINNSVLVVSGNIASGDKSMAVVYRDAAVALGFDARRIVLLEEPGTTQEEAIAFVKAFGEQADVIVVTDAVHMSRAVRFFQRAGVEPYPAPTNFLIKEDDNPFALRWMPAVENFILMDRVIREFLGSVKGML